MAKAGRGAKSRAGNSRLSRTSRLDRDGVDPVFQDMLLTESVSISNAEEEKRPLKRRRVGGRADQPHETEEPITQQKHTSPSLSKTDEDDVTEVAEGPRQIILNHSDTSDDSDIEWEDVEQQTSRPSIENKTIIHNNDTNAGADISVVINEKQHANEQMSKQRRKIRTLLEKSRRIETHKVHVLCLLAHAHLVNSWCNDRLVQATLRPLLPPRVVTRLNLDPAASQFQQSRLFLEGLSFAAELLKSRFKITAEGMKKPNWADLEEQGRAPPVSTLQDEPITKDDFKKAATELKGSQDLASELFCCLLRSVDVDTRLVCSLQPLDFMSRPLTATQKLQKTVVYAEADARRRDNTPAHSSIMSIIKQSPGSSGRIRRFGGSSTPKPKSISQAPPRNLQRNIPIMPYPVIWIEAFNVAHQKWVPVNPFGNPPVCKPSALEPPLSYAMNSMTYVIAFDANGSAKDVTKRYAKAFNAKTRKYRVESLPSGETWLSRTMRVFRKRKRQDRDQVEDAELARREAAEGLPKNVQDFKSHPYYVLERHLRRNEVIHPRNEVGKVNVGNHASVNLESIYRRGDVNIVRSADKWYRLGREVKEGEQPLKYLTVARGKRKEQDDELEDPLEDNEGRALYASFQTELYVPPPVVRGKVPRNIYGNLDVYVPSMVPPGGSHIKHREAARAARMLNIDYADAITGFQFKGRHGTAVTEGIVVAEQYVEAVETVIDGLMREQKEAEDTKRAKEVLRMWRRFLTGLRIVNHVKGYASGEDGDIERNLISSNNDGTTDEDDNSHGDEKGMMDAEPSGGGFLPAAGEQFHAFEPSQKRYTITLQSTNILDNDDYGDGGFLPAEDRGNARHDISDEAELGGGFIAEDEPETVPEPIAANTELSSEFKVAEEYPAGRQAAYRDQDAVKDESSKMSAREAREQDQYVPKQEHEYSAHQPSYADSSVTAGVSSSQNKPSNGLNEDRRLRDQSATLPTTKGRLTASRSPLSPAGEGNPRPEPKESIVANPAKTKADSPRSDDAGSDTRSDIGSMLSHDPDDEDAEPEWLANV